MKIDLRVLAAVGVVLVGAGCRPTQEARPDLGTQTQRLFVNDGFEADAIGVSPSGWTVERFLNNTLSVVPPTSQADLNLTAGAGVLNTAVVGDAITESQPDPDLGAGETLRYPKFGTRSALVNGGVTGRNQNVNALRQTITLSAGDVDPVDGQIHLRFTYAVAVENPSHPADEQAYFFVQVRNLTRGTTLYSDFSYAGQPGVPWQNGPGNLEYLDWAVGDVAPGAGASIGEQVELAVFAAGCALGGHWGRVYVDAFGAVVPGLFVSGSAPAIGFDDDDLTYTLTYRNEGTANAINAVLTFNTPPNTTFQSVNAVGCTTPLVGAAGVITCPLGTLAVGGNGTVQVTVHVDPGVSGLLVAGNYGMDADNFQPLLGSKIKTTIYDGPANLTAISGTPQSATVNTGFAAPLVVQVLDASSTPVPGVTVNFTVPGSGASATLSATSGTTDVNGEVSVTATANATPGGYNVQATAGGVAGSVNFALTNTAGVPASISVVSGGTQSTVVNTAFAAPLTVLVLDALSNPVPGATVTFTPPGSGASAALSGTFVTNASGQVSVTATANTVAGGAYVVNATVPGVGSPAVFSLTNTPGAPANIAVFSGTPQSTTVNTAFSAPVVARVVDVFNNPIPNVLVTFSAPVVGASAALSTPGSLTNASGLASTAVTANTVTGPYSVTAQTAGVGGTASYSLTNTPGVPASISALSGGSQSTTVATAFSNPLVVVVRDAFSNPVPGVTVTFTPPGSGASAAISGTMVTNASGQVSVAATANTVAGSYSVTATAPGVITPASFALTNNPAAPSTVSATSGTSQSTIVLTSFAQPLVVTVRDVYNNPVPGVTVTFSSPSAGASASTSGTLVTNTSGQVSVSATANAVAGNYSVTASTAGVGTPASFPLTNLPGAPASISVSGGSAQQTPVTTAYGSVLEAVVRDAQNNTIPNVTVTFAVPSSGPSVALSALSVLTNSSGIASVAATANTLAGALSVTASTSGVGTSATFALTNLPGDAASIRLVSGNVQATSVGTPFTSAFVVVVTDAYGNVVPGAQVTWSTPGSGASASPSSATTLTDASGLTQVTATANAQEGSYAMVAELPGGQQVSFVMTNLVGAPLSLVAISGSGQSSTVLSAFGAPLVVRVTSAGVPVAGVLVTFSAPLTGARSTLSANAVTTNASGLAQVTATANGVSGAYAVTASASRASQPAAFSLTNNPGPAATIEADPASTPQVAQVNSAFAMPLIAIVRDAQGNPVPGVPVTFSPPGSAPTAALSPASPIATDARGRAVVTAIADGTAGDYDVSASALGVVGDVTFALSHTLTPPRRVSVMSGSPQTTPVTTSFAQPLELLVTDENGTPLVGVPVSFVAPSSGASVDPVASVFTNGSGVASVGVTANTVAGTYEVVALAEQGAAPVRFQLTNTPDVVAAVVPQAGTTPQSTVVTTPFALPLVARVTDVHGNVVPGAEVTFVTPSGEPTAALSSGSVMADADGLAWVVAVASPVSGSYLATASSNSVDNTFSLTNLPGAPATISVVSGGSQTTLATTSYPAPLVVLVEDAYGNPVPGAALSLDLPVSGPSGQATPGIPTTNAQGIASTQVTANAVPGTFNMAVSAPGAAVPAVAQFVIQRIPTTTVLAMSPEAPTVDLPVQLTATVSGQLGTPTGQVVFLADGVPLGVAPLDNGVATFEMRFPSVGVREIVAQYGAQGSYDASRSAPASLNIDHDSGRINGSGGCASVPAGSGGAGLGITALMALLGLVRARRGASPGRTSFRQGAAVFSWIVALGLVLHPSTVRAQGSSTSLSAFHTAPAGSDWFSLDSLDLRGSLRPSVRVLLEYAHNPLVVYNRDLSRREVVVREQLWLNVGASLNLINWIRLSINLPVAVHQFSLPVTYDGERIDPGAHTGLGDIRFGADARIFGEYGDAAALALGIALSVPTGLRRELLGEGRVTAVPHLNFAGQAGIFAYAAQLGIALRGGRIADMAFNNELRFGASAGVLLASKRLLIGPELFGVVDLGPTLVEQRPVGTEIDLGAHYQFAPQWRGSLGVGTTLARSPGYGDVRAFLGVQWSADYEEKKRPRDETPCPPVVVAAKAPEPVAVVSDADGDGVVDVNDACPSVPAGATPDGTRVGCPAMAADADGDRIADEADACPTVPGVAQSNPKRNGCPSLVRVEGSRIIALEPVLFETNKSTILTVSYPVLQAVIDVLETTPEIKLLSVEGHTDSQGSATKNLLLSQRRAKSVKRWLVEHGVSDDRLVTDGFGPAQPVDTNDTPEGRAKNRRVEFRIVTR